MSTESRAEHRQGAWRVRHDWGVPGAIAVATGAEVVVVVDVLSFTTTLSVAADAGIDVLPCPSAGDAAGYAARHDAMLAVDRAASGPGRISLSPLSVRGADPAPRRLVLPSPNGSTIAYGLGQRAPVLIGACLRNAGAVAAWITERYPPGTSAVAVVSAGERWPDGSLRPAVEDLWGAAAVLRHLADLGWQQLSPEATAARAALPGDVPGAVAGCASGLELVANGYRGDVEVACELDASRAVPVLSGASFRDAGG